MQNFFNNDNDSNVTPLNDYSVSKTLENIRQYKRKKLVRVRSTIILGIGFLIIGFVSLPLYNNMNKTEELNQIHAEAEEDLQALERQKAALEYEVGLLEDENYIAKLARKELNLSKPNEILINLPKEDSDVDIEEEESEEIKEE